MKSRVSVIIPYFNSQDTIIRALNSVNSQTLLPNEVIIVNDFSDDIETKKILQNLVQSNWNFKLIIIHLTKNMGPGNARNIGWNNATGEYIAFLDSDDSWHPLKLEIQINSMVKYKAWFSFHDLDIYEHNSTINNNDLIITNYTIIDNLLKNKISTPTVVMLCSIKERFPNKKHSEDYSLWLQILNQKYKAIYIKKTLAYIHKHYYLDSGLSSNLIMMEFGEIQSYITLAKQKPLFIPLVSIAIIFSILKFIKRIIFRLCQERSRNK